MLNLTLIVQAIHFGIAYVIIDRIFLRAAMHLIGAEDHQEARLLHDIDLVTEDVAHITATNQEVWQGLQQKLLQKKPICQALVLPREQYDTAVPPVALSDEQIEQLAVQVKTVIVKRIEHA